MRHCWEVVSEAMSMAQPWWNADGRNVSQRSKLAHQFDKWSTDKFANSQALMVPCRKWNYCNVVEWYSDTFKSQQEIQGCSQYMGTTDHLGMKNPNEGLPFLIFLLRHSLIVLHSVYIMTSIYTLSCRFLQWCLKTHVKPPCILYRFKDTIDKCRNECIHVLKYII